MSSASGPTPPHADLVGAVLSQRFTLSRLVARGGMGSVYEAVAPDDERVAIKILRTPSEEGSAARFLREGKIASRLSHPHLVPVLEAAEDETRGLPYLVMPFLEGRDLSALLLATHRLRPAVAARIAYQACQGLAFVHSKDVVHRDIKPSNIFLETTTGSTASNTVTVRVCDFGIARIVGPHELTQLTNTGAVLGTPLYLPPESMNGSPNVDARRDVYGIGALLYEMLAGEAAWSRSEGEGYASLSLRIATAEPPPLVQRAPWVDAALAELVHRAMARDPAARPKDARELADLLRPFCGGDVRLTTDMLVSFDPANAVEDARDEHDEHEPGSDDADGADGGGELDPRIGALVDGRFRLRRLLGRGGMGSVYEAEATEPIEGETRVAVKVISSDLARSEARAVQRFLREADAVRSIENRHVVRTLHAGTDGALGSPFIVMELLEGVDLGTFAKDRGPLAVAPTLAVFLQAARGIRAAHERGVIHRDIKPANLFLHLDERRRITVKVCDFGIAKQAPSEADDASAHGLTSTGGMLGSPRYMSPEQAQDAKRVDHRSDIWSFSISLYETLSGRKAWAECSSLGEIIVAICTKPIRPLRELAPWVDPALAEIIHRGLAVDASERWETMAALAQALAEHADEAAASLTLDELRGVDADVQRDATTGAKALASERRRRRAARPRWLAAAAVLVAIGGSAIMYNTSIARHAEDAHAAQTPPVATSTTAATTAATAATATGPAAATTTMSAATATPAPSGLLLFVSPTDAVVTVDGATRDATSGSIALDGRPGDSFTVVIAQGDTRQTERVFVTSDHRLEPTRVVLDGSARPSRGAPDRTTRAPAAFARRPPPPAVTTATQTAATPTASAPAPATAPATATPATATPSPATTPSGGASAALKPRESW